MLLAVVNGIPDPKWFKLKQDGFISLVQSLFLLFCVMRSLLAPMLRLYSLPSDIEPVFPPGVSGYLWHPSTSHPHMIKAGSTEAETTGLHGPPFFYQGDKTFPRCWPTDLSNKAGWKNTYLVKIRWHILIDLHQPWFIPEAGYCAAHIELGSKLSFWCW